MNVFLLITAMLCSCALSSLLYAKFKSDLAHSKRDHPHMVMEEVEKEITSR